MSFLIQVLFIYSIEKRKHIFRLIFFENFLTKTYTYFWDVQLLYKVFIHSKLYENAMKDLECRRYFFPGFAVWKKAQCEPLLCCVPKKSTWQSNSSPCAFLTHGKVIVSVHFFDTRWSLMAAPNANGRCCVGVGPLLIRHVSK